MNYRTLGRSDLRVSEISLGSWLTYGGGVSTAEAAACVRAAFDAGINLIDTANVYGRGAAESFLGEALAGVPRQDYVLATKVYFPMSEVDQGLSAAQIEKQLDASLRRLRIDHVDLYQCHRYDTATPLEETHAGPGPRGPGGEGPLARLLRVDAGAGAGRAGPPLHPLRLLPAAVLAPLARARGRALPALLARGDWPDRLVAAPPGDPLRQVPARRRAAAGVAGRQPGHERLPGRQARRAVLEKVQRLRPIAESLRLTMSQLALAWVLRRPEVSSAIIGASRPDQVRENAAASGIRLDEETVRRVEAAVG